MKYKNPEKTPCKKGKIHSIGIWSGICSHCKKTFWKPNKKKLKVWNNEEIST